MTFSVIKGSNKGYLLGTHTHTHTHTYTLTPATVIMTNKKKARFYTNKRN